MASTPTAIGPEMLKAEVVHRVVNKSVQRFDFVVKQ